MAYLHGASEAQKLRAEVARLRHENHHLATQTMQELAPVIAAQFNELHRVRGRHIKSARRRKQIAIAHNAAVREENQRKGAYRMRIILEEIDAHNREKKAA